MNPRELLDNLPPNLRNDPMWQITAAMLRVDAEYRAECRQQGSVSFIILGDGRRYDEILAVLRSLPDDTPRETIAAALAPFRKRESDPN
jgi:hypothetical protein